MQNSIRVDIERALAADLGRSSPAEQDAALPEGLQRELEAIERAKRIAQLERLAPVPPPRVPSDDVWKRAARQVRRL